MVAAWPNMNEGANYVGALAAVLKDYPRRVAEKCVHPSHGLARVCRYKPTACDVVEWCDKELESLREIVDRENQVSAWARQREVASKLEQRVIEQRKERPTLDEMRARWGQNWGLNPEPHESPSREKVNRQAKERTDRTILTEYSRLGQAPVYAGDMLVSSGLAHSLGHVRRQSESPEPSEAA